MNRRTFVQSSIASALLAARPAWPTGSAHKIDTIGLQLYTVRNALETNFAGTIAKVAAVGYREVEFAGYFDHSPKDIRAVLDRHGLISPSTHVGYDLVENKWQQTVDAARTIGHTYIICPGIEESQRNQPDGWKRAAELFNRAGEASLKAGIQFGYHNYSFEFEPAKSLGGKMPYDFLLAETDPKLVQMEMDLCWITVAGQDPLTYFERYPGRFPLVHVKDWKGGKGHAGELSTRMADVGRGDIDWKRIFAHSGEAGIHHYFVENDEPKSIFDSIRTSFEYLRDLRF
jgi:sugar phosphate isomerase/epimerase